MKKQQFATKNKNKNRGSKSRKGDELYYEWTSEDEERMMGGDTHFLRDPSPTDYLPQADSDNSLESISDNSLYGLEESYKKSVAAAKNSNARKTFEVELCYIQREIGIRRARMEATRRIAQEQHEQPDHQQN